MRAVIYTRVSSKEQVQNFSLPTQEKACTDYCQRNGFEVDSIFIDEGESAKTADRTEFKNLLSYCRANKDRIQCVVVYSLNRFSRNSHDHHLVRALLARLGVTLRSVTEPIDDSSVGKFMEGIIAAAAQFDNDVRAERTIVGMKAAIESGRWPYKKALGYMGVKNSVPNVPNQIHDPERGPLIQQAFELLGTGLHTMISALEKVTNLGLRNFKGKKLSPQSFEKLVKNPIYAGWLIIKRWGVKKRGSFEPLVSQELFDKVQAILSGKRLSITPHLRNHPDFPLRQFIKCGVCGKGLTGSRSKGRNEHYPFYHCYNKVCKGVYVRKAELESLFAEFVEQLKPKPEYMRLFNEVVLDVWKEKKSQFIAHGATLRHRLEKLKERKELLVEAFVYKKALDKATYDEQMDKIAEDIALTEMEVYDARLDEFDIEAVLNFAEYVITNVSRLWMEFPLEQKQRLQKVLFPNGIEFSNGAFGTVQISPIFNMLPKESDQKSTLASPRGFEPRLLP